MEVRPADSSLTLQLLCNIYAKQESSVSLRQTTNADLKT